MFLSVGTKDKRAGGDTDKVQESAGVGQRSACDHRTNITVIYLTWYVDYCHYFNVKSKFGDFFTNVLAHRRVFIIKTIRYVSNFHTAIKMKTSVSNYDTKNI